MKDRRRFSQVTFSISTHSTSSATYTIFEVGNVSEGRGNVDRVNEPICFPAVYKSYKKNQETAAINLKTTHSRPQRPRSFWLAPSIEASGKVQHRKSAIHGLPVTLRMLRVKSDNTKRLLCARSEN